MKKNLFIISFCVALFVGFTACKGGKKANADEQKTEESVPAEVETVEEEVKIVAPTLTDSKAQKFVNEYAAYVNDYVDAYTTKDPEKIRKVTAAAESFNKRSQEVVSLLARNPKEYQAFADFMQKTAEKLRKVQY